MSAIRKALALLALIALVLAACAEEDAAEPVAEEPADEEPADEEPADEEPTDEEPADAEPADEEPADAEPAEGDMAVASTEHGDVLVDGEGLTLYLFDPDDQGDPTCYDDCAESWPPLVTDGDPVAGEGADEALLGTTERDDGTTQVTYDDWPLYHWAGDEEPGDTDGQGVQDVWWVLEPDGTPVRDSHEEEDDSDNMGY